MSNIGELMGQVHDGMDVVGSDGKKIGEVGRVNIGITPGQAVTSETTTGERSYFQVTRGVLGLGDDLWLPAESIADVNEKSLTLRFPSGEAGDHGWDTPPVTPEPGQDRGQGFFDLGFRDERER